MFRYWDLVMMAITSQFLVAFLWVPLTAYAHSLGLDNIFLSRVFSLCVGVRLIPNALVTRMGTNAEFVMMVGVILGYTISLMWPTDQWAFYVLAVGAGMGFARPCVSLHAKAATAGDVDELTLASKRCGAGRALATCTNFLVIPGIYTVLGWSGVCILADATAIVYIVLALRQHSPADESRKASSESALVEAQSEGRQALWIDWVLSAAFVSTDLQMNTFATAVPATLAVHFSFPTPLVGVCIGLSFLFSFGYITLLPQLPAAFNQSRPKNLIIAYFGICAAWAMMCTSTMLMPGVGIWLFCLGLATYTSQNTATQVILLECITGVCDLETSTKVIGWAEVVGCVFGVVGSYLGEVSLDWGVWAPFLLMAVCASVSWAVLIFTLGLRTWERSAACMTPAQYEEEHSGQAGLMHSLAGMERLARDRSDTYISAELGYRASPPAEPAGKGPATVTPRGEEHQQQPFLPTQAAGNDADGPSWSTARARRLKKLSASFHLAGVELDGRDYKVHREGHAILRLAAPRRERSATVDVLLGHHGGERPAE